MPLPPVPASQVVAVSENLDDLRMRIAETLAQATDRPSSPSTVEAIVTVAAGHGFRRWSEGFDVGFQEGARRFFGATEIGIDHLSQLTIIDEDL